MNVLLIKPWTLVLTVFCSLGCSDKQESPVERSEILNPTAGMVSELDSAAQPQVLGVVEEVKAKPIVDVDVCNLAEPDFEDVKLLYGKMRVEREGMGGSNYQANVDLRLLLRHWSPDGLSVDELKDIIGEPETESASELRYSTDNGFEGSHAIFKIVDGKVEYPHRPLLDFESGTSLEKRVAVFRNNYRNSAEIHHYLRTNSQRDSNYYRTGSRLNRLFGFWSPDGLSVEQLKEIIGEPDVESETEVVYDFETEDAIFRRRFEVVDGVIRIQHE